MNQVLDTFVAIHAIELGVNGFVESVCREDESHDLVADFARGGGIEMAIETVGVGKIRQCRDLKAQPQKGPTKKPDTHTTLQLQLVRRRTPRGLLSSTHFLRHPLTLGRGA